MLCNNYLVLLVITSFYADFSSNVFSVCESPFYVFFFFFHLAWFNPFYFTVTLSFTSLTNVFAGLNAGIL